jgi:hypothetical protein
MNWYKTFKMTELLVFSNEPNGPGIHVGHVWNYVVSFAGLYYVEFFTHSSIDDVKSTLDSNTGVHIRFYEGKTVEDNLALGIVHGSFSQLSFAAKESSPDILTGAINGIRRDSVFFQIRPNVWINPGKTLATRQFFQSDMFEDIATKAQKYTSEAMMERIAPQGRYVVL